MALDANDLFSGGSRIGNESPLNSTKGYSGLLHAIYPGVGYFTFDDPGKYQEPDQYPVFNINSGFSTKINANDNTVKSASSLTNSFYVSRSMDKIIVDPEILLNCSKTIGNCASTLDSVNKNLDACGNSAPSYGDDHFDSKIRKIVSEMSSIGSPLSTNLSGCAKKSDNKARQFLDADWASSAAIGSQFNNLSWMIPLAGFSWSVPRIPFSSILEGIYKKAIELWTMVPGHISPPAPKTGPTSMDSETNSQLGKPVPQSFASEVPANGSSNSYTRLGYYDETKKPPKIVLSNCTWYVAAAVKEHSNNNIDLQEEPILGAGAGSTWNKAARDNLGKDPRIVGVDNTPEVGAIYQNGDHVAFVHDCTQLPDGSWEITVSEENAGNKLYQNVGGPIDKSAIRVDNITGDDPNKPQVFRYIRKIKIPKDDRSSNFIHLDYSYKKP